MTELKTEELQKAINEIKKKISDKQNEKRNLESQKSKLEFSIKDLQKEIDSLKDEEEKKRREYFNNLLEYAKDSMDTMDARATWVYKDDNYVIFQRDDFNSYFLFSSEDSELIEIDTVRNTVTIYDLREYEDLLDDKKSDSYNCDTFIRRNRIDEIEHYYYSDSLADYMYWMTIDEVDLDDLLEDESSYIKWYEIQELKPYIDADAQYFTQRDFYSLKEEENETNK